MAIYEFLCEQCGKTFDALTPYDATGQYTAVVCSCGSRDKKKLPSMFAFNFSNPEGTDRWNSDAYGHDYRYKAKIPQVQAERTAAQLGSHMGSEPYKPGNDLENYDIGIHDA